MPDAGPGYAAAEPCRAQHRRDRRRAAAGELTALYLFQTDPVRDLPDRALWERALHRAALVVAHASVLTDGLSEHADGHLPGRVPRREGGHVVHPDGRLQRLRIAIAHPGEVRAGWSVLAELARARASSSGCSTTPDGASSSWSRPSRSTPA